MGWKFKSFVWVLGIRSKQLLLPAPGILVLIFFKVSFICILNEHFTALISDRLGDLMNNAFSPRTSPVEIFPVKKSSPLEQICFGGRTTRKHSEMLRPGAQQNRMFSTKNFWTMVWSSDLLSVGIWQKIFGTFPTSFLQDLKIFFCLLKQKVKY